MRKSPLYGSTYGISMRISMVQVKYSCWKKSGVYQLRLVVYSIILQGCIHSRWFSRRISSQYWHEVFPSTVLSLSNSPSRKNRPKQAFFPSSARSSSRRGVWMWIFLANMLVHELRHQKGIYLMYLNVYFQYVHWQGNLSRNGVSRSRPQKYPKKPKKLEQFYGNVYDLSL